MVNCLSNQVNHMYRVGISMRGKQVLISPLFFLISRLAALFKVSFMVGSYAVFFSAANCVGPLAGAFCGMGGSTMLFGLAIFARMVFYGGLLPLSYLAHFIPGLCAGYYWASRSATVRLLIPMLCMALFLVHPVGGAAWLYTVYWLIPIALYVLNSDHLFLTALGSTFTAHAVGSVIWLYTVPMNAGVWLALIPEVLIERLLFATGMVMMHKLISWGVARMRGVSTKKQVSVA